MAHTTWLRFEWDEDKNAANQKKHKVSFEEASELLGWERDDVPLRRGLVLVVWVERLDDVIRIISARFATVTERGLYESHRGIRR